MFSGRYRVLYVVCLLMDITIGFVQLQDAATRLKKRSICEYGQRRRRYASLSLKNARIPRKRIRLGVVPGSVESLFDPTTFAPVCGVSDGLYREAQQLVYFIAGRETFEEYAPLIAGALLRLRLELCVIESFIFEAVLPFIKENGVSWFLPAQETVQTFLTGSIFAIALNVIFVGSTKIISLIVNFFDIFLGMPTRFLTNLATSKMNNDDASTTPITITLFIFTAFGKALEVLRKLTEFFDVFVGRYLAILTVIYLTFKFLHFRVLTGDMIPF